MPEPEVRKGESRESFMSRCMEQTAEDKGFSDADREERAAYCYSLWEEHKEGATKTETEETD